MTRCHCESLNGKLAVNAAGKSPADLAKAAVTAHTREAHSDAAGYHQFMSARLSGTPAELRHGKAFDAHIKAFDALEHYGKQGEKNDAKALRLSAAARKLSAGLATATESAIDALSSPTRHPVSSAFAGPKFWHHPQTNRWINFDDSGSDRSQHTDIIKHDPHAFGISKKETEGGEDYLDYNLLNHAKKNGWVRGGLSYIDAPTLDHAHKTLKGIAATGQTPAESHITVGTDNYDDRKHYKLSGEDDVELFLKHGPSYLQHDARGLHGESAANDGAMSEEIAFTKDLDDATVEKNLKNVGYELRDNGNGHWVLPNGKGLSPSNKRGIVNHSDAHADAGYGEVPGGKTTAAVNAMLYRGWLWRTGNLSYETTGLPKRHAKTIEGDLDRESNFTSEPEKTHVYVDVLRHDQTGSDAHAFTLKDYSDNGNDLRKTIKHAAGHFPDENPIDILGQKTNEAIVEGLPGFRSTWYHPPSGKVIEVPDDDHHTPYLRHHPDQFGLNKADLPPETGDDLNKKYDRATLAKAYQKGWARVQLSRESRYNSHGAMAADVPGLHKTVNWMSKQPEFGRVRDGVTVAYDIDNGKDDERHGFLSSGTGGGPGSLERFISTGELHNPRLLKPTKSRQVAFASAGAFESAAMEAAAVADRPEYTDIGHSSGDEVYYRNEAVLTPKWKVYPNTYTSIGHEGGHKTDLWSWDGRKLVTHPMDDPTHEGHDQWDDMKDREAWGRVDHDNKKISFGSFYQGDPLKRQFIMRRLLRKYPNYSIERFDHGGTQGFSSSGIFGERVSAAVNQTERAARSEWAQQYVKTSPDVMDDPSARDLRRGVAYLGQHRIVAGDNGHVVAAPASAVIHNDLLGRLHGGGFPAAVRRGDNNSLEVATKPEYLAAVKKHPIVKQWGFPVVGDTWEDDDTMSLDDLSDEEFLDHVQCSGFVESLADKDPKTMTAGEINKELDRVDKLQSKHTDKMIAAGRGGEKHSETMSKADGDPNDELAQEHKRLTSRHGDLRYEVEARYGKYVNRLPVGRMFGPRRRSLESVTEMSLNRIIQHTQSGKGYVILSANRNERTTAENREHESQLRQHIRSMGKTYTHLKGGYIENRGTPQEKATTEPSFMVHDVSPQEAQDLATHAYEKHQQEAVLHVHPKHGAQSVHGQDGHREQVGDSMTVHPVGDYFSSWHHRRFSFGNTQSGKRPAAAMHGALATEGYSSAPPTESLYLEIIGEGKKEITCIKCGTKILGRSCPRCGNKEQPGDKMPDYNNKASFTHGVDQFTGALTMSDDSVSLLVDSAVERSLLEAEGGFDIGDVQDYVDMQVMQSIPNDRAIAMAKEFFGITELEISPVGLVSSSQVPQSVPHSVQGSSVSDVFPISAGGDQPDEIEGGDPGDYADSQYLPATNQAAAGTSPGD